MSVNSTTGTAPATGAPENKAVIEAFDSILNPKGQEEESEAQDESTTASVEGDESEVASTGDELGEAESDEGDDADEGSDEGDQTFRVKVDGEDVEVPLTELLAGYSRTADYTRKTQALSGERKTLEQDRGQVRQMRAEYETLIPHLRRIVESDGAQEPDWAQLKAQDPNLWAVKREEWRERTGKLDALKAEETRIAQERQAEEAAELQSLVEDETGKLLKAMPSWKDEKVATADRRLITDYMLANGFTQEDLEIYDHRAILTLHRAAKYVALEAKRKGLQKQIDQAPVVKPSGGVKPKAPSDLGKAQARLARSGSKKDAAAVFERLWT